MRYQFGSVEPRGLTLLAVADVAASWSLLAPGARHSSSGALGSLAETARPPLSSPARRRLHGLRPGNGRPQRRKLSRAPDLARLLSSRTSMENYMRHFHRAVALAAALSMAACAPTTLAAQHAPVPAKRSTQPTATSPEATVTTPPPRPQVVVSRFRAADSTLITLATITGAVQYRLHSGSEDPGPAALGVVSAGPSIGAIERSQLLAAFNGGFKLSAGAGGYEQEGHVISPLRAGLASLVIDNSGTAQIGVWGSGFALPGESVFSVRQNLVLLVRHGRVTPATADWTAWGATLGGGEFVARSALGENARGELIYAASMSTAPGDLAAALAHAGARTAMELDINPEWVQLDIARAPGRALRAAIPGQARPADQYLIGWTRDFITVLG
jgi:hypothetical protein